MGILNSRTSWGCKVLPALNLNCGTSEGHYKAARLEASSIMVFRKALKKCSKGIIDSRLILSRSTISQEI